MLLCCCCVRAAAAATGGLKSTHVDARTTAEDQRSPSHLPSTHIEGEWLDYPPSSTEQRLPESADEVGISARRKEGSGATDSKGVRAKMSRTKGLSTEFGYVIPLSSSLPRLSGPPSTLAHTGRDVSAPARHSTDVGSLMVASFERG